MENFIVVLASKFKKIGQNIFINQEKYILTKLQQFGLTNCKPNLTLSQAGMKLTFDILPPSNIVVHDMALIPYANAIGGLIHATTCTHFDIVVNNTT
jgi:hypothetical protein